MQYQFGSFDEPKSNKPGYQQAVDMGGLTLCFVDSARVFAQQVPAPGVEWRSITYEDDRPVFGMNYAWNAGTLQFGPTTAPDPNGEEQEREESGEEWYYGMTALFDANNVAIGYATVGYASWTNWAPALVGCQNSTLYVGPSRNELETIERVKGRQRGTVAMFNLEGEVLWYSALFANDLYGVIQTSDGGILICGGAGNNAPMPDMPQLAFPYNYASTTPENNIALTICDDFPAEFGGKPYLAKFDLEGNLLWIHAYGPTDLVFDSWTPGGIFFDVCEVTLNGTVQYVAVGQYGRVASDQTVPVNGFIVRTDANGLLLEKHLYEKTEPLFVAEGIDAFIDNNGQGVLQRQAIGWRAIDVHPNGTSVAVSGSYSRQLNGTQDDTWLRGQAMLDVFDLTSASPLDLTANFHHTGDATDAVVTSGGNDPSRINNSWGATYVTTAGTTRLLWPVLSNYPLFSESYGNTPGAGKSIAFLKVHGFNTSGALLWSKDLGEVRAYDLQAEGIVADNGNSYALVCSKWPEPFAFAPPSPSPDPVRFDWDDLDANAQQCLTDHFTIDPTGENGPLDWEHDEFLFAYWNTDAYIAKLDPVNGMLIWETTFDSEPGKAAECTPGDLRKQECMYEIAEAPDGGLVVCGNASHNLDDYYLAKLYSDCMGRQVSLIDYDNMPGFFDNNTHTYTVAFAGETWNADMNMHGIIRIPDGITLTITNGATIRFADSEQLNYPTRISVEPGGKLIIDGNAVLTSIDQCPNSMWDGILNQGTNESQDGNSFADQGLVDLESCTIENARTGVACNSQFVDGEVIPAFQLQFAGGGVVRADGTTFRNCVRAVVMGLYENHAPGNTTSIRPNRSKFTRCTFEVTASLSNTKRYPLQHAYLLGVRGVVFEGCGFYNYGPFGALVHGELRTEDRFAGTGILAINSSVIVRSDCNVIVQQGTPCPAGNLQRGRFEGLAQAMYVSSFDPSRTFSVDQCDFHQCYLGIRAEGVQDLSITRNTFLVGQPLNGDLETTPYGVYADQCTGYEMEENSFVAVNTATEAMVGLVIKDSGPYSNRFYNNTFDGFDHDNSVGSLIEGVNADANNAYLTGLETKCNDYGQQLKNAFDVALTGPDVSVKNKQGTPINDPNDPQELKNPAGNRFSAHTANDDPEADWFVEGTSNAVEYFHHSPSQTDRTEPAYRDPSITATDVLFTWPGKTLACPSDLSHGSDHEAKKLASAAAESERVDAEAAYDAAKDDGDSYTLLAYVSDASKTSTQVRNALQSIAPKVSEAVWTAAFDRNPAMSQLHMAQALLNNSPLQTEVLKLMKNSGMSAYYQQLVWNAQDGSVPVLTLLESAIAYASRSKAEALTDLGRLTWLDETTLSASLEDLKTWHEGLPAENNATTIAGVLAAKADGAALFTLAQAAESTAPNPAVFGVLKRYANRITDGEWITLTAADETWLLSVAAQRSVIGSANAQAWLTAQGHAPAQEVIILPTTLRSASATVGANGWSATEEIAIAAYPNPANDGTVLDLRIAPTDDAIRLRLVDVTGRTVHDQVLGASQRLVQLGTQQWPNGLYLTELWLGDEQVAALKLAVQH